MGRQMQSQGFTQENTDENNKNKALKVDFILTEDIHRKSRETYQLIQEF